MTRQEFKDWLKFHQDLFPEVSLWLSEPDRNSQTILNAWLQVLQAIPFDEAKRCTMRMLAGEVEHPNRFEVSRLPAIVIAACPRRLISGSELQGKIYNPHTGELT